MNDDIKTHILSDNSGYFISGYDSSSRANICKYLFSNPSTAQCQIITSFKFYSYGQLMLSSDQFFAL